MSGAVLRMSQEWFNIDPLSILQMKSVGDPYHRMLFIEDFRIPGDEDAAFAVGCCPDDGGGKFDPVFSSRLDCTMRDL